MKKIILMMAAVVAISFTSCDSNSKYAAQGKQLAEQLDQSVEKADTAAALAAEIAIREAEKQVEALGDSAALAAFSAPVHESLQRNAPFLTTIKVDRGMEKDKAVGGVIQDVMDDKVDISAVTASIDSVLINEQKKEKE